MYHRVRRPIVFHSNPGMWFPIMQAKDVHELVGYVANMYMHDSLIILTHYIHVHVL